MCLTCEDHFDNFWQPTCLRGQQGECEEKSQHGVSADGTFQLVLSPLILSVAQFITMINHSLGAHLDLSQQLAVQSSLS